jgi:molecular chaperone HscA
MHARAQLEAVAQDTDETIIKDKIDNLEAISAKFVQMRMNSTISKAMRGHNVEASCANKMESFSIFSISPSLNP